MKKIQCEKCCCNFTANNFRKHYEICGVKPQRNKHPILGSRGKWSKGLTKETDPRVAAQGRKTSVALSGRPGHSPSEDHKKRLSEAAIARGFGGTTQSRWIEYCGVKLGSSYEVQLAVDLDKNKIKWEKPKRFRYVDPKGKQRTYTPDFYLPEFDLYLDPKNDFLINNINPSLGFSDTEKISLVEKQNNIKVLILSKNELTWNSVQMKYRPYGTVGSAHHL